MGLSASSFWLSRIADVWKIWQSAQSIWLTGEAYLQHIRFCPWRIWLPRVVHFNRLDCLQQVFNYLKMLMFPIFWIVSNNYFFIWKCLSLVDWDVTYKDLFASNGSVILHQYFTIWGFRYFYQIQYGHKAFYYLSCIFPKRFKIWVRTLLLSGNIYFQDIKL